MSDPVFNPWDVWHVRFEFAEGKGYEYRPAIVLGRRPGGAIVMMVTGANNKLSLAHDYLIKDWRAAGLDKPPIAHADRIIEISPAFVGTAGKIGELSAGDSNALALLLHRMTNNGDDRP